MKQRVLIVSLAIVLPLPCAVIMVALASPWSIYVNVDSDAVDFAQGQREAAVTIAFSHTASLANNSLILCSVQSSEVVTGNDGLYLLGTSTAIWVGDVLTSGTAVYCSSNVVARPHVPCALIESGLMQQVATGTIGVMPYRVWLPTTLKTIRHLTNQLGFTLRRTRK